MMTRFVAVIISDESSLATSNSGVCMEGARCWRFSKVHSHDSLFYICSAPSESFRCKLPFYIAVQNPFLLLQGHLKSSIDQYYVRIRVH